MSLKLIWLSEEDAIKRCGPESAGHLVAVAQDEGGDILANVTCPVENGTKAVRAMMENQLATWCKAKLGETIDGHPVHRWVS